MRGAASGSSRWCTRAVLAVAAWLSLLVAGCAGGPQTAASPKPAPDRQYSFWPPLPNEPRVQFLTSYRYSADIEPRRSAFDDIVFGAERQVLPIGKPYGVAVWQGRIYVCDITNPGVVILDLEKRQTRVMGMRGMEVMAQPTDIAIAGDGMKYVVDRKLGRIFVFGADDRHVVTFGETGMMPVSIAVHGDELYVADFKTQSVLVLDRFRGTTLRALGGPGGEEGRFIRPLGLDIDDAGAVYVSDVLRGRLQKFTAKGDLVYARGEIGDAPGNFVRPKHLAIDAEGILYVVDAAFQNVQMFNAAGELLMFFGASGEHPGAMSLPAGIAVSSDRLDLFAEYVHPAFDAKRIVVVTNQFGLHKVAVYALGGLKPGRSVDDIAPYAARITAGTRPASEVDAALQDEVAAPAPDAETPKP
jgi:DNA-binding beta-propeller fold protein YncE